MNADPEMFRTGKEVLYINYMGFLTEKDVIWVDDLDKLIITIRETGIYNKMISDSNLYRKQSTQHKNTEYLIAVGYFSPGVKKSDSDSQNKGRPLSPDHLLGTVFMWIGGISLAILAFIFEHLINYRFKKNNPRLEVIEI